jgi:uncharacterized protein YndB with AHSA1/START domain
MSVTADTDDPERDLRASRLLRSTPAEVFAAIADPLRLARWWGPNGFSNRFEAFEFKPGGAWTFTMHGPDGTDYPNRSEFGEIVPSERVVIHHRSAPEFTLTITLGAEQGGTRLGWRQHFATIELCRHLAPLIGNKNEENLDRLEAELARR